MMLYPPPKSHFEAAFYEPQGCREWLYVYTKDMGGDG